MAPEEQLPPKRINRRMTSSLQLLATSRWALSWTSLSSRQPIRVWEKSQVTRDWPITPHPIRRQLPWLAWLLSLLGQDAGLGALIWSMTHRWIFKQKDMWNFSWTIFLDLPSFLMELMPHEIRHNINWRFLKLFPCINIFPDPFWPCDRPICIMGKNNENIDHNDEIVLKKKTQERENIFPSEILIRVQVQLFVSDFSSRNPDRGKILSSLGANLRRNWGSVWHHASVRNHPTGRETEVRLFLLRPRWHQCSGKSCVQSGRGSRLLHQPVRGRQCYKLQCEHRTDRLRKPGIRSLVTRIFIWSRCHEKLKVIPHV